MTETTQNAQEKQEAPVNRSEYNRREYNRRRADGLVGLFTLIAIGLLFGGYCWWKSYSPLNPPQRFYVVFHDVASLNYQAAVFVHGVRVGSVDDIKIRAAEDDVLVRMKVNTQKCKIPVGSHFMILPNGVVGAKYIEIIPPDPSKGRQTAWLTEKSIVEGDEPVRPEIVVTELVEKLGSLDFSQIQDKLVQSLTKMSSLADHVNNLSDKMLPVAAKATATADSVNALAKKMLPVAAKATAATDSVNALAQEMRAPVSQLHQILDQKHPLVHMMFGRPGHLKEKMSNPSDGKVSSKTTKSSKIAEDTTDSTDSTDSTPKKKHHHFLGL